MTERRFGKYSISAYASLALGICCALFLLAFIVLSEEGQRRIAFEFGLYEPVHPLYGEALHAAMGWQIRNVLGLALVFLGSAAALALGIVAWRGRPQAKVVVTAIVCLSLLDLVTATVLVWAIS